MLVSDFTIKHKNHLILLTVLTQKNRCFNFLTKLTCRNQFKNLSLNHLLKPSLHHLLEPSPNQPQEPNQAQEPNPRLMTRLQAP